MSKAMTQNDQPIDIRECFEPSTGALSRRVFADETIYQQELRYIFGRAWNFMCHETQLPEPGSFFMNYIGEDEVIVVRDRHNRINVLLNSCPHRGNSVCRAELGTTKTFLCSYHGWNFDLEGKLIGMPGEKAYYRNETDKQAWGLPSAAKVESYRGFVFATLDPDAPPLEDYLGWVGRLGIDMLACQGDIECLDGVYKNRIQCNWKVAVDNLYDWYHVKVSHGSAMKVGFIFEESMSPMQQMVILGEYGHGIGGPGVTDAQLAEFLERRQRGQGEEQWYDRRLIPRSSPAALEQLGPVGSRSLGHPNIFPNLWISLNRQFCLRIPRGPMETELWWFSFQPKEASEEERRMSMFFQNHVFGPAGLLEQDDGENWSHSTRGARGTATQARPLNLAMGLGQDQVREHPSGQHAIETVVNEHAQRWTYQAWQEWMLAESWADLMANHSAPPTGEV